MAGFKVAAMVLTLAVGAGIVQAQTGSVASSQDKQFLKNTEQDSNYEIKTGQLALQKSSSADVKQYAGMVIQDHTKLKQETALASRAAKVNAPSPTGMSVSDTASYTKMKLFSGSSFDESYIKGLVKGNADSLQEAKSEADTSTVPAVKKLAEHRVALDAKHTQKAEQLAAAHHIDVKR